MPDERSHRTFAYAALACDKSDLESPATRGAHETSQSLDFGYPPDEEFYRNRLSGSERA
jgi:hypothetical protein